MDNLKVIAHIQSDFPEKFGIPRQSNVVQGLKASVIFVPEYRNADALRGLEDFSHLWLIWGFSEVKQERFTPTVRPPRLGGNARMGVFATRSPYRPNPIGLSCVQIERVEPQSPQGPVIHVLGADLMDGTPIYDIKPYLPYVDSRPAAKGGFAAEAPMARLRVEAPEELLAQMPPDQRENLTALLRQDPRPSYQEDAERVYGMAYAGLEVKFRVRDSVLAVTEITKAKKT